MRIALSENRVSRQTKLCSGRARQASRRSRRTPVSETPPLVILPNVEAKPKPETTAFVGEAPAYSHRGDTLQLYLQEIGQVKLITPKEEIALAKRIKKGDADAREQMIKANLRLVVKIARDYDGLGLPLLDLINEGNIGLMKGVERFKPNKGAKLSTYASWWIKQAIKRALANQSKTIRLPVHVVDKVAHIRRAEMKLREALGHDPSDEEIAADVQINPRSVQLYREAARAPVSLDAPMGDDEPNLIGETVPDTNAAAPYDHLVRESDTALLAELVETLPQRERAILGLRFGLNEETPRTLEEIGQQFKLTRERIRQIQEEALKKLRAKMEERDSPGGSAKALAV
ncbi:MAG: polymerase primary sigma factor [Verrucomicrobiota bacterium]